MKNTCNHKWKEDEMFADGVVMMFSGGVTDLEQESRYTCEKCGAVNYFQKPGGKELNLLDEISPEGEKDTNNT